MLTPVYRCDASERAIDKWLLLEDCINCAASMWRQGRGIMAKSSPTGIFTVEKNLRAPFPRKWCVSVPLFLPNESRYIMVMFRAGKSAKIRFNRGCILGCRVFTRSHAYFCTNMPCNLLLHGNNFIVAERMVSDEMYSTPLSHACASVCRHMTYLSPLWDSAVVPNLPRRQIDRCRCSVR